MLKKIVLISSIICFVVSAFFIFKILFAAEPRPEKQTQEIYEAFLIADEYIKTKEALPTKSEMSLWFENYKGQNQYVERLLYQTSTGKNPYPAKLGNIPDGSYQLAYWRSELMEEYAPWLEKSTMCSIERTCNSFSNNWVPLGLSSALGIYLLWGFRQLKTAI